MKWVLFLECLVGRHDWNGLYEYPPRNRGEFYLEPAGLICSRCNKIRRLQE